MRRNTRFQTYHPALAFLFFMGVIVMTFCAPHPVFIAESTIAAFAYYIYLKGWRRFLSAIKLSIGIIVLIAFLNAAFVSAGTTVMFEVFGHGFSLEALSYGLMAGCMLVSVIFWFACYEQIVTTEKFLYLFSRFAPTFSLMVSMVFRLIPDLISQARLTSLSQYALVGVSGSYSEGKSTMRKRSRLGARLTSVLMGLSLEDGILTADSMKARGYGSKNRTTYARYSWGVGDTVAMAVIVLLIALSALTIAGAMSVFVFYPTMTAITIWWGYLPFLVLVILPFFFEVRF